jgi:GntR family transcriptional regulator
LVQDGGIVPGQVVAGGGAVQAVAADITTRVESGELTPGTRLRSERDLAAHYEVAYRTIRRAMEVLRERGLIVSIHGRGTFVREHLTSEP